MDTPEGRRARATSFDSAAAEYARARPPYPPEAVDWMLPAGARRVLDLGAGTGKLTAQLQARGLDVVAVEPLPGMRAQLSLAVPDVEVLTGTAETIPLPDASVDAVLAAQAWHWVDPQRAVPEVARVLRPGGRLGLVWNIRDETAGWQKELGELLIQRGADAPDDLEVPAVGPPFADLETHEVRWTHNTSRDLLEDLIASRSYVIMMAPEPRRLLLDDVRQLVDRHLGTSGSAAIEVRYVTRVFRTRLVD